MKTRYSLKSAAAFICVVGCWYFLVGCSSPGSKQNTTTGYQPNYSTPPLVINVHQHSKTSEEWEKSFLEVYDKYNSMACLFYDVPDFEHGIAFAKAHPQRVIPFARIALDSPTVLEDIKRAHEMGFKGFGESVPGSLYRYDDPHYEPVWSLLEELGMVPLLHTGVRQTGVFDLLRPATLATIAANHPNLNIIGAHFGNPWYEEAAEGSRRNKNLYWDITGSSLIKKENDPGYWSEVLWWTDIVGKGLPHTPKDVKPAFEYLIFGVDEAPDGLEENIRRFNKMLDANNVPDSIRAKMYGLTLVRILDLEIPSIQ